MARERMIVGISSMRRSTSGDDARMTPLMSRAATGVSPSRLSATRWQSNGRASSAQRSSAGAVMTPSTRQLDAQHVLDGAAGLGLLGRVEEGAHHVVEAGRLLVADALELGQEVGVEDLVHEARLRRH